MKSGGMPPRASRLAAHAGSASVETHRKSSFSRRGSAAMAAGRCVSGLPRRSICGRSCNASIASGTDFRWLFLRCSSRRGDRRPILAHVTANRYCATVPRANISTWLRAAQSRLALTKRCCRRDACPPARSRLSFAYSSCLDAWARRPRHRRRIGRPIPPSIPDSKAISAVHDRLRRAAFRDAYPIFANRSDFMAGFANDGAPRVRAISRREEAF